MCLVLYDSAHINIQLQWNDFSFNGISKVLLLRGVEPKCGTKCGSAILWACGHKKFIWGVRNLLNSIFLKLIFPIIDLQLLWTANAGIRCFVLCWLSRLHAESGTGGEISFIRMYWYYWAGAHWARIWTARGQVRVFLYAYQIMCICSLII